MAIRDQQNQLNLTVVALVALVAIVGLVALVLNTASLAQISTGGSLASAEGFPVNNTVGDAVVTADGLQLKKGKKISTESGPLQPGDPVIKK